MTNKPFIVYRSSAGSGKTFTLSLIYLKLLLEQRDPNYFRSILALTFTVKAAAEMKDRITSYLSDLAYGQDQRRKETPIVRKELMNQLGVDTETLQLRSKAAIAALLHNYSDFQILTIDKFIARLTRSFSSDLSLAPDFEIEIDQGLFTERVIEEMYAEVGGSESTTKLLTAFLKFRLAQQKSTKLEDPIGNASHAMLSETFFFLKRSIKSYDSNELFALKERLEERIKSFEEQLKTIGTSALTLIDDAGLSASDLAGGSRGVFSFFKKLQRADLKEELLPSSTVEKNVENNKWKSAKGSDVMLDLAPQLLDLYNDAMRLLAYLPAIKTDAALLNEVFTLGFVGELARLAQKVRNEENIQLLGDLSRIISTQFPQEQTPFIYERLGTRINHILVDEFQDTSDLQWNNLMPLFENALSEDKATLIVGDGKQSIYRFRGSEPQLFNALPLVQGKASKLFSDSYREERLAYNYRSAINVVNFNNRFFEAIRAGIDSQLVGQSFDGHQQVPFQANSGKVRWWFNPYEKGNKLGKKEVMSKMTDRIEAMVNTKERKASEICCLFRSRADAAECSSQLLARRLRVISEESLMLEFNPAVGLIITTLKAMRDQQNPFLCQAWLSKFHHWSNIQAYHELACQLKSERWGLHLLAKQLGINLPQRSHNNAFTACLKLVRCYDMALTDPFIRRLLDFALAYEQSNGYLNAPFLDHWEQQKSKLSIDLPEGEDAIRVMTIHKSKGLEFPVTMVFLPNFSKGKSTHESLWVRISAPENVGVTLLRTSDLKGSTMNKLYEEEDEKSMLDFINLVYVAFTRAEDQLEIFSNEPSESSNRLAFLKEWDEWDEKRYALCID